MLGAPGDPAMQPLGTSSGYPYGGYAQPEERRVSVGWVVLVVLGLALAAALGYFGAKALIGNDNTNQPPATTAPPNTVPPTTAQPTTTAPPQTTATTRAPTTTRATTTTTRATTTTTQATTTTSGTAIPTSGVTVTTLAA
jgi:cytoskeletal protein RodZ